MELPNRPAGRLLVVHENSLIRRAVALAVGELGFESRPAESLDQALASPGGPPCAGILVSADVLRRADQPVAETLPALHAAAGTTEVMILVDAPPDFDFCREVVAAGIAGFVTVSEQGVDLVALRRHVVQAAARHAEQQRRHNAFHFPQVCDDAGFVVRSPLMAELLGKAERAGKISDVPILIYGESGTGKQLLAEIIHRKDAKRCGRRFLSVNCAAISGTLADSALFGHMKGSFTGASDDRQGHFRAADGGTLLLDEVGELDLSLQPKLLRVLQEGMVLPVGADEEVPVDVRVIAATNRRLAVMVEEGRFRLDLYQRLNVIVLEIPPLRERPEDIPALVQFFVKIYAGYYHGTILDVDPRVHDELARRTLTGNVRELENTMRQVLAFKIGGQRIELADLAAIEAPAPAAPVPARPDGLTHELVEEGRRQIEDGRVSLADFMDQVERRLLTEAMKNSTSTHLDLARRLGLSRRTFYNKLRKHRL